MREGVGIGRGGVRGERRGAEPGRREEGGDLREQQQHSAKFSIHPVTLQTHVLQIGAELHLMRVSSAGFTE